MSGARPIASSRATLIGFVAVLLWALLAALTALSGDVPPLQLNAMTFAVAAIVGMVWAASRGGVRTAFRQPVGAWIVGVGGLFGYHALYFTALRLAPTVQASLIAYLWPLLIVLGSALIGERLRLGHVAGALIGLAGAALIVLARGDGDLGIEARFVPGYLAAIACAFTWSGYSLLSRRLGDVPTEAVAGFCLATAILSLGLHLAVEETVWPATPTQWLAVLGLGLGPVGGAFFVWDHGVKRGDIRLLGAASYSAPVLSTLVLIALGLAALTWSVVAACVLVTLGAVVAARAGRER